MSRKVLVLGEVREDHYVTFLLKQLLQLKQIADGGEVVGVLVGESVASLG